MSNLQRSTVTKNEIAARWNMFGPPPLLKSENKQGYDKLRNAFVRYFWALPSDSVYLGNLCAEILVDPKFLSQF
jgi:hypothetical protein